MMYDVVAEWAGYAAMMPRLVEAAHCFWPECKVVIRRHNVPGWVRVRVCVPKGGRR